MDTIKPFTPSDYKIATRSYIYNIASATNKIIKFDLYNIARYIILGTEEDAATLDGALIGLKYFNYYYRGCLKSKSILTKTKINNKKNKNVNMNTKNKDFKNQITFIYKYYGCRTVNIKLFNNGELQLSGVSSTYEANKTVNYLIKAISNTTYNVFATMLDIPENKYDFIYVADQTDPEMQSKKYKYYYYNYFQYFDNVIDGLKIHNNINYLAIKNFVIQYANKWIDETIIDKWLFILNNEYNMLNRKCLKMTDLGTNIKLINKLKKFILLLKFTIQKIQKIKENDAIQPINTSKSYLIENYELYINKYVLQFINACYYIGFSIKNNILYNIFKHIGIVAIYKPDDYPGLLLTYYWNQANTALPIHARGKCICSPICTNNNNKKNKCFKITIIIFQTGNIIITGAKDYNHTDECYQFINFICCKFYDKIKSICPDNTKPKHKYNPMAIYLEKKKIKSLPSITS